MHNFSCALLSVYRKLKSGQSVEEGRWQCAQRSTNGHIWASLRLTIASLEFSTIGFDCHLLLPLLLVVLRYNTLNIVLTADQTLRNPSPISLACLYRRELNLHLPLPSAASGLVSNNLQLIPLPRKDQMETVSWWQGQ